jgi:tRNA U34 2-thiouridine synthase MnmA/TrmU
MKQSNVRALGLLSGGLDSILAVKVLQAQGISVTGISFETPFFNSKNAGVAAEQLSIPLVVRDITAIHLEMLREPKHGFGANMNPCIDCHILMVKIADCIMREQGLDFVFTGEVLNERPMSQNRRALRIVQKESGCGGRLLRPLSAKLLEETLPEKEGKVNRDMLFSIHGRSRKPQMELAAKYGLSEYPTPAGGCLLTDPRFSQKLRDLWEHEGLVNVKWIALLKTGRHFRLDSGKKAIVGRNREENETLVSSAAADDMILKTVSVPGPVAIVPGGGAPGDVLEAARLCARYSDAGWGSEVVLKLQSAGGVSTISVPCPNEGDIKTRII